MPWQLMTSTSALRRSRQLVAEIDHPRERLACIGKLGRPEPDRKSPAGRPPTGAAVFAQRR
jgi:hypothetical protein